ncbi:MAG: 4-vinyl reductase, partial [Chloroflexota bacterium]
TLERHFDFADIAAINEALEEMYGTRGGRGMALRIGQSAFARGIKGFGAMRGVAHPAFKTLPLERRVDYGLRGLAAILTNFTDQTSYVENQGTVFLFKSEISPFAWGRTASKPVCHMMAGIILECLRWSSNGYEFYVREIECTATGHEQCVFRINKSAIGERISYS